MDWTSIKDGILPAYEVEVLTTDGKYCNVGERVCTNKHGEIFKRAGTEGEQDEITVTHWMPLPELPHKPKGTTL